MTKERAIEVANEFVGADATKMELVKAKLDDETNRWNITYRWSADQRLCIIVVDDKTARCVPMDILQD